MPGDQDDLLQWASRVRSLDDHGAHERAFREYCELLSETQRRGTSSPFLLAAAARAAQSAGHIEVAVDLAEEALRADELNVAAIEVLDAVAYRVGAMLARPNHRVDDPSTPKLYQLLVRAGRRDASSLLALARRHEAQGNRSVASALRDAIEARTAGKVIAFSREPG